jgi:hypothetical protein
MVDVQNVFVAFRTRHRYDSVWKFRAIRISQVVANFVPEFRQASGQAIVHGA